jgi:hypothetical protein
MTALAVLLLLLLLLKNLFIGHCSHAGVKLPCRAPSTSMLLHCHHLRLFIYIVFPHLNGSGGTDLTVSSSPCARCLRLLHPSCVTARRCWADPCDCVWKYYFYICLGTTPFLPHTIAHPKSIAVRGAGRCDNASFPTHAAKV